MSDKISNLPALSDPNGRDLLLVIDMPSVSGTPYSKNITLKNFFGNITSNTAITGTFSVSGNTTFQGTNTFQGTSNFVTISTSEMTVTSNGIIITNTLTPANSAASGISTGKIFYDSNYLYIKVSNTTIKRVALSSF